MSLADDLDRLWSTSDSPPDLVSWVNAVKDHSDAAALLTALKLDQKRRWKSASPWLTEDYLSRLPLATGPDWRFELAVGEFEARRDTAQPLSLADLSSRFPDLSETLKQKLVPGAAMDQPVQTVIAAPGQLSLTATYITARGIQVGQQGRYRLDRILGEGNFGRVYLGYDTELRRQVAVKVPKAERFKSAADADQYLNEARLVAALKHPQIVAVHDVGRTEDQSIYVVSQYIEGGTLEDLLKQQPSGVRETVEIIRDIALALHHAHLRRLIHRDIKPANILIDSETRKASVTDFGLAIREDEYLDHAEIAGTPAFMSPEQARGEGHRLDGRSDLFSLGVIFYQMLTGSRPFRGSTTLEILHEVISVDPPQPRFLKPDIPAELERICLKALAKRASDRYATTAAFAEDLQAWLQPQRGPAETRQRAVIKPKGLRSFDAGDADFFLDLLPGTRDRHGLPESIAFWKERIESHDSAETFAVGLIYGPSGCGKSSLVKAGLLPRLAPEIVAIYVEATPQETELRICTALRRRLPDLPAEGGVIELLTAIRRNPGPKVAIFLDQFEQWLHENPGSQDTPLVRALRQCDRRRLQTVLMIRDDFYVSVSRLMEQLDTPIVQRHNCAMVDLFDTAHAQSVLRKFGTAYGKLPEPPAELPPDQQQFLDAIVSGLAESDRVISVRLALFAEMIRSREWGPATLQEIGGTSGVGVSFLEETFSNPRSDARYRVHTVAVRGILKSLLPGIDTEIKGAMKSVQELRQAAGYANKPGEFNELLRILDGELRLITPTDAEGHGSQSRETTADARCYQLTHDFLVPSLRTWLTRKQAESRQGRAELLLEERTKVWQSRQEDRQLPSLTEYLRIRRHVKAADWTETQRQLMSRSARRHGTRALLTSLLGCLLLVGLLLVRAKVSADQEAIRIAGLQDKAESLSNAIPGGRTSELGNSLKELQPLRDFAVPRLQRLYQEAPETSEARLHLGIALLTLGAADDEKLLPSVGDLALRCRPEQLLPLVTLLQPWAGQLAPDLATTLQNTTETPGKRLHAACLLAGWEATTNEGTAWADPKTADFVAAQLVQQNPVFVGQYQEVLRPQASRLTTPLATLFSAPQQGEVAKTIITGLLADYAKEDAAVLARVLLDAAPDADKALFPLLTPLREDAIREFHAVLDRKLSPQWSDDPIDPAWLPLPADVQTRIASAHGMITDRFALCLDIPLSQLLPLVESLRLCGYRPTRLRPHAGAEADDPRMSAVWTRDGVKWAVLTAMKPDDLPQPDANAERDGLLLSDLVLIPGSGPHSGWLTLWNEAATANAQRRCAWGLSATAFTTLQQQLTVQKFATQLSLQVYANAEGKRRFAAVFSNDGGSSVADLSWSGRERIDSPQWDLTAGPVTSPELADTLEEYRRQIREIQAVPAEQRELQSRLELALALFQTGQPEQTLVELDGLKENISSANFELLRFRTVALAQLGRTDEATTAFAAIKEVAPGKSYVDYVAIQLAAWQQDVAVVRSALDAAVTAHQANGDDLYNIACAAALAARAFRQRNAAPEAAEFSTKALTLLQQALDAGYAAAEHLQRDPDFADLHQDARFLALVQRLVPSEPFAGIWHTDGFVETRLLRLRSSAEILSQLTPLLSDSWRSVAVAVQTTADSPLTLVLLERPLIPEADRDALAIHQAAAAVALLRLDATARVWPLLQDSPNPGVRSYVLHRLPRYGLDARTLVDQLTTETDAGRRRGLIQGLGELAAAGLVTDVAKPALISDLLFRYSSDPDSGVHGMCEWTLRQLGAEQQLVAIQQEFAKGTAVGNRRWYLTQTGGKTQEDTAISLAIVNADQEFLMGSPMSESGRYDDENLHRRRINRTFAIGMHEITVAQFRRFRRNHGYNRQVSEADNMPANNITWYEAAEFCNWLSKEEGISQDQWCYSPDQQFASGMRLRANYLQLTGYRLPTEAEWEYACRSGTFTARFFGSGDTLLGDYAWYTKNSGDTGMLPVGSQRPNGNGLFGMYGNALEWCQDAILDFPVGKEFLSDAEQSQALDVVDTTSRVLRGGSFVNSAALMRSALRYDDRPDYRGNVFGFRVSRTYPLPP